MYKDISRGEEMCIRIYRGGGEAGEMCIKIYPGGQVRFI